MRLAVAFVALGAALPVAAQLGGVSVYGTLNVDVEAVRGQQPNGDNPTTVRISSNSSNFGFRGTEPLGGGLAAFFQVEYALGPDDGGAPNVPLRDSFVGLQGDWGSVQLGYFLAPYDDISPLFGSVPTYLTSILSTSSLWSQGAQSKANGGFDTRLPNSIRYDSPGRRRLLRRRAGGAGRGAQAPPRATATRCRWRGSTHAGRSKSASATSTTTRCAPRP